MSTDFGHTHWAEQARMAKAVALETQLTADGIPSDAVRRWDGNRWEITLPERSRRRLEKAAGVRRSSDETWLLAAALLADYEATRARFEVIDEPGHYEARYSVTYPRPESWPVTPFE